TAGARSHAAIAAERQEGRCPNPAAPTTPAAPVCPARKSSASARQRCRAPALRLCDHVARQGAGGMPGVPRPRRAAALEHSRSGRLGRNRPGHLSGLRAHGRRTGNADRVRGRSNRRRVPASTMFDGNERRAVAIRRPYMWHVPAPGAHRARMSQWAPQRCAQRNGTFGGGAMNDRQHMRASDADRQEVVDQLAAALEEGRLKMDEYAERMGLAYQAVTYGDLAALSADLPQAGPVTRREAAPPAAAPQAVAAPRGVVTDLPAALKVLWTIWLGALRINVLVW